MYWGLSMLPCRWDMCHDCGRWWSGKRPCVWREWWNYAPGPIHCKGYWNMPDATAAVFRQDGGFLTGDIGYLDEEGILYITDRKKDMIIISGWKIYPTEVENVIIRIRPFLKLPFLVFLMSVRVRFRCRRPSSNREDPSPVLSLNPIVMFTLRAPKFRVLSWS